MVSITLMGSNLRRLYRLWLLRYANGASCDAQHTAVLCAADAKGMP